MICNVVHAFTGNHLPFFIFLRNFFIFLKNSFEAGMKSTSVDCYSCQRKLRFADAIFLASLFVTIYGSISRFSFLLEQDIAMSLQNELFHSPVFII